MLNFQDANAGLDLIAHGDLVPMDPAELSVRTHRLIERLLEQIDMQHREPTPSEDTYLRRAIAAYAGGIIKEAVSYAFRAAQVRNTPIAYEIFPADRTNTLRSALRDAEIVVSKT